MKTDHPTSLLKPVRQHALREGDSVADTDVSGRDFNHGSLLKAIGSFHAQVEDPGIGPDDPDEGDGKFSGGWFRTGDQDLLRHTAVSEAAVFPVPTGKVQSLLACLKGRMP